MVPTGAQQWSQIAPEPAKSLVVNFPAKKAIKPEDSDLGGNNLDRLASGHPTYTGSSSVGTYPSLDLSMQSHQRHSQADHAHGTSSIATQEKKISWPEGANPGRDKFDDLATVASSSPIATRPTRKPAAADNTPFSVARGAGPRYYWARTRGILPHLRQGLRGRRSNQVGWPLVP